MSWHVKHIISFILQLITLALYITSCSLKNMFTLNKGPDMETSYGYFSMQIESGNSVSNGRMGSCNHNGEVTGNYIQDIGINGLPLEFSSSVCAAYATAQGTLIIAIIANAGSIVAFYYYKETLLKILMFFSSIMGIISWTVYYNGFQIKMMEVAASSNTHVNRALSSDLCIAAWVLSTALIPFIGHNPWWGLKTTGPKMILRPNNKTRKNCAWISSTLGLVCLALYVVAITMPHWLKQSPQSSVISSLGAGEAVFGLWQICVEAAGISKCADMQTKITGGIDSKSLGDFFSASAFCDYQISSAALVIVAIIASAGTAVTKSYPRFQAGK